MPLVPSRTNQPPQVIYVQTPPPATVPIDKVVTMAVILAVGAVTATTGLVALVKVRRDPDTIMYLSALIQNWGY
jgi:anaerobic C4-dicarboxylate transporter